MVESSSVERLVASDYLSINVKQPHKIITISILTKQAIFAKCLELYSRGHSLRGISNDLGLPRGTVRDRLLQSGVDLRAHSHGQILQSVRPKKMSIKNAPYGYCLVSGRLVEDPKEYQTLQTILKWWEQGVSDCEIARRLNLNNMRPRKAKAWSQGTISSIRKRYTKKISKIA